VSSRAKTKVTGVITVDRVDGTVVLTVTNVIRRRAVTVYLTAADARRLARTLTR
jgi:hypothetical protein